MRMGYFSITHNLHLLTPHLWKKGVIQKNWCLNSGEYMMLQKNLKYKWIVLYGIELSTKYGIYEGTVATHGVFIPKTTRDKQLG